MRRRQLPRDSAAPRLVVAVPRSLAPIGFIFFQWYVDRTAGERGAWFRVQREAWSEGTSFGATAITNSFGFLTNPL